MTTHLEIESKFDAAPDQALPDLVGVGGVTSVVTPATMVLTATYYDTEGLALGAAGATLRRRTGGADDGWHLKLSVADGERLEVRRALGRGTTPPAALTSLVRGLTRDDALVPVAELVSHRQVHHLLDDSGRVLVEIADDRVTGQRLDAGDQVAWREVEAELVEGDRDAFAAVAAALEAGGLAPSRGSSKVGRVLGTPVPAPPKVRRRDLAVEVLDAARRAAVRALLTADPLLRADRPGAASRMRAAVRRLRVALAVGAELAPRDPADAVRAELGWLDGVVAALEEADVVRPRLRAAVAAEQRELVLGPVQRRLDRELAAARKAALAGVRDALDSPRYLALLATLAMLVDVGAPGGSALAGVRAGQLLPELAERTTRRAVRRVGQLRRAQSDQGSRRLLAGARRAVERALVAESVRPGGGDDDRTGLLDEAAALLAKLETSLRAQDVLRAAAGRAQLDGENGFTFGRLHGLEDMRAADLHRRLGKVAKLLKTSLRP